MMRLRTPQEVFEEAFVSEVEKLADAMAPPAPTAPAAPSRMAPYLATEHAEHLTDVGGLGLMMGANADRIREGFTGKRGLSDNQRDMMDLAGLGVMAAPSFAAAKHLSRGPAGKIPLAGGGSRGANIVNLAGLAALGLPVMDRMQARWRGDPERGRLLGDRSHALLELGGYGALAGNVLRNKIKTPLADKHEHKLMNRALMGYGLLAAPEVPHALSGHRPEHPSYDPMTGQPIPEKPGIVRPISDMVGMALLGSGPLAHLRGGHGH